MMMKIWSIIVILALTSFTAAAQTKYKCNVQMINYKGEAAYIVVSLVDAKGVYVKTLYMMGKDQKWYDTLKEWDKAQKKKKENISAITGASVGGAARTATTFTLDDKYINKGYKIRFESAVENEKYYTVDAEIPYTSEQVETKVDGKGYVRFVKLTKL